MTYNKVRWVNNDTVIKAVDMNRIEDGIEEVLTVAKQNEININALKDGTPEKLNSLKKIADALGNDDNFMGTFKERTNAISDQIDLTESQIIEVKVNGENQQNFNFIENKVVQDGLVDMCFDGNKTVEIKKNTSSWTAMYKFKCLAVTMYSFVYGDGNAVKGGIVDKNDRFYWFDQYALPSTSTVKPLQYEKDMYYEVVIIKNDNLITLYVNNALVVSKECKAVPITIDGTGIEKSDSTKKVYYGITYNRPLTPKEIQHNFSVLNNAPSINSLHSGDKKLLLGADSHHVEMATGRTLEEEYTSLLKQHGKEVNSKGEAITVNNGIKGRIISGEIKGQTINNLLQNPINYKTSEGRISKAFNLPISLDINKQYTFVANTLKTSGIASVRLQIRDIDGAIITIPLETSNIGISYYLYTPNKTINRIDFAYMPQAEFDTGANREVNFMIFEGDVTNKIKSYIPFGLSSTRSVISNNGQSYPIYEPTIAGTAEGLAPTKVFESPLPTLVTGDVLDLATKTITFANKTTQVLADEQLEAYSAYKKVILLNKVSDVADTVSLNEDGGGVWQQSTKEIILNGSENYLIIGGTTDTMCFSTTISQQGTTDPTVICNLFKYLNDSSDVEHCRLADNGASFRVWILKTKLTTQDVAGFKIWLASNNIIARYKLATPTITTIPKELMPTVQTTDKINIFSVDSSVTPASLTLNIPVDRIGEIEAKIEEAEHLLMSTLSVHID